MSKALLVIVLSLFVLAACSSPQKDVSIAETIQSAGIHITEMNSSKEAELNGVLPASYKLDNGEMIKVYDFGSNAKREMGYKQFLEHQQLLSSHAPIVYQAREYLVLYGSNVDSRTQTPKLSETMYGNDIQKALKGIK